MGGVLAIKAVMKEVVRVRRWWDFCWGGEDDMVGLPEAEGK